MKEEVVIDWNWANGHMPAIAEILQQNALYMLGIRTASPTEDLKHATDLVISVVGGDVAVRIRRAKYVKRYRDLTIRAWRAGNIRTELQKIQEGWGDWYLYGWSNGDGQLQDWLLVDLNILRKSGLLEAAPLIPNKDGRTAFIAISDKQLKTNGCLVASAKPIQLSLG